MGDYGIDEDYDGYVAHRIKCSSGWATCLGAHETADQVQGLLPQGPRRRERPGRLLPLQLGRCRSWPRGRHLVTDCGALVQLREDGTGLRVRGRTRAHLRRRPARIRAATVRRGRDEARRLARAGRRAPHDGRAGVGLMDDDHTAPAAGLHGRRRPRPRTPSTGPRPRGDGAGRRIRHWDLATVRASAPEPIYERAGSCRWCPRPLHRHGPGEPWMTAKRLNLGDDPECPERPNPEGGPMPYHEPGTPAVRNPDWGET